MSLVFLIGFMTMPFASSYSV